MKIQKWQRLKNVSVVFSRTQKAHLSLPRERSSKKKLKHLPHTRSRLHSRPKITVPSILAIIRWLFSPNCPTYFSTTKAFFVCVVCVQDKKRLREEQCFACQLAERILKICSLGFFKFLQCFRARAREERKVDNANAFSIAPSE